jgi:ABC-type sugar transport system permease subunit
VAINTVVWVVTVVSITFIVSLVLAQLLDTPFPGRRIVRYALIIPWAASLVMTTLVFRWMFNFYYGLINRELEDLHLHTSPVDWLGGPVSSFVSIVLVGVFVSVPFTTYVFLAGLQSLPGEIYEAAKVDGASGWQAYRRITLPLLRPAMFVAGVLNVIYVFNSFPVIWLLTQGGPGNSTDTTITFMYKLAFQFQDVGESAALSVINVVAILVVVGGYLRYLRRTGEV